MQSKGQGISLSRDIDILYLFHVDMSERRRELARLQKQRQRNSTNADIRHEEANKLQELLRPIKGGINFSYSLVN